MPNAYEETEAKTDAVSVSNSGMAIRGTADESRIEAPITVKTYLMCCFAAFGGIFFGYDSGYISGVMGMDYFIHRFTGKDQATTPTDQFVLASWQKSLITSIMSAGTFFGALIAGDVADFVGRRPTIISGCVIFIIGTVLQTASTTIALLAVGRIISGFGLGFVSAIIILYMSEIAPRKVRGAIVSGYQFCVTIGLLLASCVDYGTQNRNDSGSYRIPVSLQMLWSLILGIGLFILPESPRYYVKKDNIKKATQCLARLRDQPEDSDLIRDELAEIIANNEFERSLIPTDSYISAWTACFTGGLRNPSSNLRKTILGTSLQMMQQWTGINFIFYFGTTFFQQLGTIKNEFLMSIITTLVNVCSTPISFYTIEHMGRRVLMIYGAAGMVVCEFIVAIVGTTDGQNHSAVKAMISFICIYIFFFASTWGPGAWVIIGEIFPIQIRAKGVALSTASNWLWNCIISVITPYMVDTDKGNLGSKVFFVWGSLCGLCLVYAIFLIPETKGLTLEQVDQMMMETTPLTSSRWKPHQTFAEQMGIAGDIEKPEASHSEGGSEV
ncbi:DEKNAAC102519 [Brettanomyces naardenensis]|uniref:DEKNAAC102520 n=1 Tax=Brettanomyces naardenensis TaxID=13370 RepID=A0A448YKQ8_BRENA|nr:DEKNAAC102519 [Brettanomyces naardenensis]